MSNGKARVDDLHDDDDQVDDGGFGYDDESAREHNRLWRAGRARRSLERYFDDRRLRENIDTDLEVDDDPGRRARRAARPRRRGEREAF
ncbi:MAG: hypothetical protein H6983_22305 [Ectothiorhodospiraceae bacterium]|nr:hypothetical protein [Chromatiales bacterium]MCP5156926.1 hypothetical protein [Ectothiorhodospiraceae bacterium]